MLLELPVFGNILASQGSYAIYPALKSQRRFAACFSKKVSGNSSYDEVGKPERRDGMQNPLIAERFSERQKSIVGEEPEKA
jgi:hypothetical protein